MKITKIKTRFNVLNGKYTLKVECKKVSKQAIIECLEDLIATLEEQ
jgi:hypothetical protein